MRIMIDTNILVSAVLFPKSKVSTMVWDILLKHELIISSYAVEEIQSVFKRKFPDRIAYLEEFLSELAFDLAYTPEHIDVEKYPKIRDPKDLPILVSAIISDVDLLVTGDKDFEDVDIERPEIINPNGYMSEHMGL